MSKMRALPLLAEFCTGFISQLQDMKLFDNIWTPVSITNLLKVKNQRSWVMTNRRQINYTSETLHMRTTDEHVKYIRSLNIKHLQVWKIGKCKYENRRRKLGLYRISGMPDYQANVLGYRAISRIQRRLSGNKYILFCNAKSNVRLHIICTLTSGETSGDRPADQRVRRR